VLAIALAEGSAPTRGLEVLLVYTGVGPLLPALTGLAMRGLTVRRSAAWPVLLTLLCACVLFAVSTGSNDLASQLVNELITAETLRRLTPLCAIPWLLAFHRLVATGLALRPLLWGGVMLAAITAVSVGLLAPAREHPLLLAAVTLVLLTYVNALGAFGVVLARRFRRLSVLPEDHAALHWAAVMRDAPPQEPQS
jgi:hypothetical protein